MGAAEAASADIEVMLVTGGTTLRRVLVPGEELIVGRETDCDLCVADSNVSRRHLRVEASAGRVLVEDLGSSNGTLLRGRPLSPGIVTEVGLYEPLELASSVLIAQPRTDRAGLLERLVPILHDAADFERLRRLATTEGPVSIGGPAGAGKTELAHILHQLSGRRGNPLHFDARTVEAPKRAEALFGRDSADGSEAGAVDAAQGGTLIVENVEELDERTQLKLLICVERKSYEREGGFSLRRADASVFFTSRHHLGTLTRVGGIVAQLRDRLRLRSIDLLALDDRREDLARVAESLTVAICRELGRAPPPLPEALVERLGARSWPGNLRELRAVLTELLRTPKNLGTAKLPAPAVDSKPQPSGVRQQILEALHECNGNQTAAAKLLGISRRTLINRIEFHGIPRPRKR